MYVYRYKQHHLQVMLRISREHMMYFHADTP